MRGTFIYHNSISLSPLTKPWLQELGSIGNVEDRWRVVCSGPFHSKRRPTHGSSICGKYWFSCRLGWDGAPGEIGSKLTGGQTLRLSMLGHVVGLKEEMPGIREQCPRFIFGHHRSRSNMLHIFRFFLYWFWGIFCRFLPRNEWMNEWMVVFLMSWTVNREIRQLM